jgi:hypothetical protein
VRQQLQARSSLPDTHVKALLGKVPRPDDFSLITRSGDISVFKPDGTRLLTVLRGALDLSLVNGAFPFMWGLRAHTTTNRGNYSGEDRDAATKPGITNGKRTRRVKADGTISNTPQAAPVRSVVVGAFDRSPRIPYCRQTAYSTQAPGKWAKALPFIQQVSMLFKETVPDRYASQLGAAQKTHPAYIIPGTNFTTITVNNTVAGAYHTDKGDYPGGFGVIVVMRKGSYGGAELGFPRYGVAADLQHGDIIFFDPHEVHGNTPFRDPIGREGEDFIRISMVFYFRTKMMDCLEPVKEVERAKMTRGGFDPSGETYAGD